MLSSGQVEVGTAVTYIMTADSMSPFTITTIFNIPDDSALMYMGGSDVTAETGLLAEGEDGPFAVPMFPGDSIYGIAAGSAVTVTYLTTTSV